MAGPPRIWSLSSWGEFLIANPSNLGIYVWQPPDTFASAAQVMTAPLYNTGSFVISQAQILMCYGAESGGTQYPSLLRWSDVGDYTEFTPSATNQAGSFSIPSGAKIVAGMSVGLGALIWTDTDLWSITYQGLPFVFGLNRIATECEAATQKSVVTLGNLVMWLSTRGFFRFDGNTVSPIACPVFSFYYDNVDLTTPFVSASNFGGTNSLFSEAWWFFRTTDARTAYVKYSFQQAQLTGDLTAWDYGYLTRTAWTDHSPVGNPMGVDGNHLIQVHEVGEDGDGDPIPADAVSGLVPIADGENYWFVDQILPDFQTTTDHFHQTALKITITSQNYPGDAVISYGPFTYTYNGSEPAWLPVRVRGRLIGFEVETNTDNDAAGFWRLGLIRYRYSPAGRN